MSSSSDEHSDKECPLCMELLEIDDLDFYPCKCEYQICRFCWHRLKNDENGLCPACRQPYPEDPVNFKPLSSADLQRIKDEKKMKQQAEKMRVSEERKHLANFRVLQKNLVYVVGLSTRYATEETLRKQDCFGRFGKILKIVLGTSPVVNLPAHLQPSHTAYITYSKVDEALRAIQGVNNTFLDNRVVKASLGTTKYCSSFLRSQTCGKPECMYLHDIADNDISFTKEDMHAGKHSDYEKRLIEAMMLKRQALERRQAAIAASGRYEPGLGYEDDGTDVEQETAQTSEPATATPPLLAERQDSQEKENRDVLGGGGEKRKGGKGTTSPAGILRRSSPPSQDVDHDSSYSSMNADFLDHQQLDTELSRQISMDAPPGLIAAPPHPGLVHSSSTHSLTDNTSSKLLRLMNLSEGSGRGAVPAPAPQEEAPAVLTNWQTLLGLSPPTADPLPMMSTMGGTRRRPISPPLGLNHLLLDDDLGFDPFSESTKGLAALLEEERVDRHRPPSHHHSMPQYHLQRQQQMQRQTLADLWSTPSTTTTTAAAAGVNSGVHQSRSHSAFAPSAAAAAAPAPPAPFDMFGLTSSSHLVGSSPFGYNNPTHHHHHQQQQQHHHIPPAPSQYSDYPTTIPQQQQYHSQLAQQQQQRQQMSSAFGPPPGLSAQPSSRPSAHHQQQQQPQSMAEWQEGLKALLPNVNVRFSSDFEQQAASAAAAAASQRWNATPLLGSSSSSSSLLGGGGIQQQPPVSSSTSAASAYASMHQMLNQHSHHHHHHHHAVPPPPGFSIPNR